MVAFSDFFFIFKKSGWRLQARSKWLRLGVFEKKIGAKFGYKLGMSGSYMAP